MGMMMHSRTKEPSTTDRWGSLVTTIVNDLAERDLGVASIAVMDIESKSNAIDVEWIRQKLIAELVALDRYQILSRDRIHELLQEQGLAQTGSIDSERAVQIGKLIGVESFMYGYVSMENGKAILSLQLIKTDSSVILWAKTIDE
jgi:TolB-like protein